MSAVDHPAHYNAGPIETIDVIESQGWGLAFCLANVVKYAMRAEHKGQFEKDIAKIKWYADRALQLWVLKEKR